MPTKKMDAKRAAKQRRLEIEAAKARARSAERRRSWLLAGGAIGIGALLIIIVELPSWTAATPIADRSLSHLGVSVAKASCSAVQSPTLEAKGDVAATTGGKATVVAYKNTPPTSGKSFTTPADNTVHFYSTGSGPAPETLVRNLQDGYTVLWYTPGLPQSQVDELTYIGDKGSAVAQSDKFIIAPWDTKRGAFPAGKNVALASWGSVQFCAGVSGKTVQEYITAHPPTKAPTPTGS